MRLEDLDYDLPRERIAQQPAEERDAARMLVVRRGSSAVEHATVRELPRLLPPRTTLVVNDTRVLPARLRGTRAATGGKAELLLVRLVERPDPRTERWTALLGTRGRPREGETLALGPLDARLLERRGGGEWTVELRPADPAETVERALGRGGAMPLPPYIRRDPGPADRERYQTVYAERPGAVAAPTAGLHFTPELLARLAAGGHEVVRVTLHVGPGTFKPITAATPAGHVLEAEWAELSAEAAARISEARTAGRTVLAVGTTVVRTLETAAAEGAAGEARAPLRPWSGDTGLYLLPGHRFRALDALLTNFHLPRTSLLALVMAFHGVEPTRAAYAAAIRDGYRFYSYGDAMLVLPEERR
ncbi:MAG: tRNA preQ1(34) S-adenosylmethionine ribosyltransferase-isomerase QueA [Deltaproteobacteria bacterium]|nr:tRNA preQ1(34) S-adenosylmethionine ribosyltransferase-isomerase QueA [Deltaproteobacteria bacterium]